MCLVISLLFISLAYMNFEDNNMQDVYINGGIAIIFIILMIRNILKTKKQKNNL